MNNFNRNSLSATRYNAGETSASLMLSEGFPRATKFISEPFLQHCIKGNVMKETQHSTAVRPKSIKELCFTAENVQVLFQESAGCLTV